MNSLEMKQFMKNAPANIFFKDTECKYLFASEICSLVYADEEGGITGKTDLEIQSIPELGRFYYEDDKKFWQQEREANMSVRFQ